MENLRIALKKPVFAFAFKKRFFIILLCRFEKCCSYQKLFATLLSADNRIKARTEMRGLVLDIDGESRGGMALPLFIQGGLRGP